MSTFINKNDFTLTTTNNQDIILIPNGTGLIIAGCGYDMSSGPDYAFATKDYVDNNGGGGGGTPGGTTTQIQYNNTGTFAGDTGFTTDGAGLITIVGSLDIDNINIDGSIINIDGSTITASSGSNADIIFNPAGIGLVVTTSGYNMSSGPDYAFATKDYVDNNGGGLSNVVDDTTPQLGGDLDLNGNQIVDVSSTNADIILIPNGTGLVVATSGYDMSSGPDYAFATKDYVDNNGGGGGGTPGGTTTQIQYNNTGTFAGDTGFTTDGAGLITIVGSLDIDNINIDGSIINIDGSTITASSGSNADIILTPNGTGLVVTTSGYDMSSGPDYAFATKDYVDTKDALSAPVENGFENRTDSTLSFDDGTRTLDITGTYTYWAGSIQYQDTNGSIVIDNTEGLHYIYYDGATLSKTTTFTGEIITDYAFVAAIYWDAINSTAIIVGDERHGHTMDSATHSYNHNTFGTRYGDGLAITDIVVDQSGDSAVDAQIGVTAGSIWDEDIKHTISANAAPANIPLFYRSGSAGDWRMIAATDYPVTTTGSGRAAWNEDTGATWQLTEVDNNDFFLTHILTTGDINHPVIGIIGQNEYNSLGLARDGAQVELLNMQLGSLNSLSPEFKAIGTIVFQTSDGSTNAVKSAIRSPLAGGNGEYIDWRISGLDSVAGSTSGIENVVEDITPQLGGNLDLNGNQIVDVSSSNADIILTPNGTGLVVTTSGYDMSSGPDYAFATKDYVDAQATPAGESNLISSVGSGTSIVASTPKNGVTLQVRSVTSTGGTVTISQPDGNTVNLEAPAAGGLDDLTDVTLTSPSSDEILTYNGSQWVNTTGSDTKTNVPAVDTNASRTMNIASDLGNSNECFIRMSNSGAQYDVVQNIAAVGQRFMVQWTNSSPSQAAPFTNTGGGCTFVPSSLPTIDTQYQTLCLLCVAANTFQILPASL